jgi:Zn-finger nucleic acid-binding protein
MTAQSLGCPRCGAQLTQLRVGGTTTDICERCGGLWLDRLELSRFEDPDSVFGDALVARLTEIRATLVDHTARLRCPRHPGAVMLRRAFSRTIPIQIDECPQCGGLWLDAGELAQIRR